MQFFAYLELKQSLYRKMIWIFKLFKEKSMTSWYGSGFESVFNIAC